MFFSSQILHQIYCKFSVRLHSSSFHLEFRTQSSSVRNTFFGENLQWNKSREVKPSDIKYEVEFVIILGKSHI